MKKRTTILLTLVLAVLSFANLNVCAAPVPIHFSIGIIDPTSSQDEPQRSSVPVPCVEIEDNILIFLTSCERMELRLVNEGDVSVFTTIITDSTLELPSSFSGLYQLQILLLLKIQGKKQISNIRT